MRDEILPDYLKDIAYEVNQKNDKASFKIKCLCGSGKFDFYKKKIMTEEKAREKKLNELLKVYNGDFYRDADGNLWLCSKSFLGIGKKKLKITEAEHKELFSNNRDIVIVRCNDCGKEYVLFDSNVHGYDGVTDSMENPQNADRSAVEYEKIFGSAECKIEIRNTCSFGEFKEEFGEEGDYATYTNAFSDIKITALIGEREKTILDVETQ